MNISSKAKEALIKTVKENDINALRDSNETIETPWGTYLLYPFMYNTDVIKSFRFPGNINVLPRKNIIYIRAKILSNLPGHLRVKFKSFSL